jgi:6-phosphogluconolactonase
MHFHLLESHRALIHYVATKIKRALNAAIQEKGHALLVLPGGETPRALYTVLSEMDIPWHNVTLFLTDERCVDASSQESNSYWVRKLLLHHAKGLVEFVHYEASGIEPIDAVKNLNQQMSAYAKPFDFVLLGMGGDGHVASLFLPNIFTDTENGPLNHLYTEMTQATSDVIFVQAPISPFARSSLSFSRLLHTQELAVLMTGTPKWQQLQESSRRAVLAEKAPQTAIEYLLRYNLLRYNKSTPVQIFWAP